MDMDVPLELSFKGIKNTDPIEAVVREKVAKLERVCGHLNSCRVAIEKPQRHQDVGREYRVRIDMTVPPGHELVVKRESSKGDMHDPLDIVIRDAFNAAARRLEKLAAQQQGEVKSHPDQQTAGVVDKLFPEGGYGFLRAVDTQEEIYFHRNSVLHDGFDRLAVGTGVRYIAEMGLKGPQATTVQIVESQRAPTQGAE
jgi:cold shock CspA family protein